MPQAPAELQAQFEDDGEAMALLKQNYSISATGVIRPREAGRVGTSMETAAISYLVLEWGYAWNPQPRVSKAAP